MVYNFPLSQKARAYLKFEDIFERVDACQSLDSKTHVRALIRAVIDYMDMVDGYGALKIELLKDLDKLEQKLKLFAQEEQADKILLQDLNAQIQQGFAALDKFSRQGSVLRDDSILALVKPRLMTPCGVNSFDTPLYKFFLERSSAEIEHNVQVWLEAMDYIRKPLSVVLYIARLCTDFEVKLAKGGFMQENSEACDFVAIKYPPSVMAYPVVSGFQSALNVRFTPYYKGSEIGDIEFEIAYISLSL